MRSDNDYDIGTLFQEVKQNLLELRRLVHKHVFNFIDAEQYTMISEDVRNLCHLFDSETVFFIFDFLLASLCNDSNDSDENSFGLNDLSEFGDELLHIIDRICIEINNSMLYTLQS